MDNKLMRDEGGMALEVSRSLLPPVLILAVFIIDRTAKALAAKYLFLKSFSVFPFFKLTYVENTGVAFGMFRGKNDFFVVFSALLIGALVILRRRIVKYGVAASAGLALVLGGALGNLYDRLAYGYVIDFFDLRFFPAVFNVADSSITIGACLLALSVGRIKNS